MRRTAASRPPLFWSNRSDRIDYRVESLRVPLAPRKGLALRLDAGATARIAAALPVGGPTGRRADMVAEPSGPITVSVAVRRRNGRSGSDHRGGRDGSQKKLLHCLPPIPMKIPARS